MDHSSIPAEKAAQKTEPPHMEWPQPEPSPCTWIKPTLIVSLITAAVQIISLQSRRAIFGGDSIWFTNIKYTAWSERLGLCLAVALLSLTLTSAWFYGWHRLHPSGKSPRSKTLHIAVTAWAVVMLSDQFLWWKTHTYLGPAFDFTGFVAGTGSWTMALSKALQWFWVDIYQLLGAIVLTVLISIGLYRVLQSKKESSQLLEDTFDGTPLRRIFLSTLAISFCLFTFLTPWWSTTKLLLSMDCSIGIPFQWTISTLTDFDGDGYGPFDAPADTAPFDSEKHPYALDIPDDGVDQDLLLGDLKIKSISPFMKAEIESLADYPSFSARQTPNIIYITLESVRFDSLRKHIKGSEVMPHLRSWVDKGESVVIPGFYASQGFTKTSVPEIFQGNLFPTETTLVDDLKRNGYQIWVASGYNLHDEGLEKTTKLYLTDITIAPGFVDAEKVDGFRLKASTLISEIDALLSSPKTESPFFFYIHFTDPHFPYDQSNAHILSTGPLATGDIDATHREALEEVYYNQIHHVDMALGELRTILEKNNLWEDTIVFLISDHGESLFDDGFLMGHGTDINEVMTHCLAVVRNSPMDLETPMSHYHLRHLIRKVLTETPQENAMVKNIDDREILHYLGWLQSPYRIGSYSNKGGRAWFDFRNNRAYQSRTDAELSLDQEESSEAQQAIDAMIYRWEYLQFLYR